ncbi:hypothetical protein LOZ39_001858 [Ophidiomyces ophidiicola]|nr:hypothetical protein LOZ61_004504 [Ophidiomyces ophidiicola]KAI2010070.1 hypothetical protein LOZ50_001226 [Ophidiomyces ophidiicola]KAI2015361.1 hypothetical protein LOZ49_000769 [Ophidiomyces ophidiicola]KAI2037644.1 hypothetical protein LOZ48_000342 [Ophidiomyces ophidiicola]KAI2066173.1 hypothetical protein LOZ40_003679 [Ophidiomyces ophidiicola]
MPITPLEEVTASAIGSTSAVPDPCSVVKELIDNALDAKAKAVYVEISSNTLDVIQVKDNGCGIPRSDITLLCKRNCTSKIQTLDDLRNLGGNSLGFRGQALASIAEMSECVIITTREASELAAISLKFGRTGQLLRQVLEATVPQPIGTSIRVSNFLKYFPVRQSAFLKSPSSTLSRVKKMLQQYALCRPYIRFSLKILKQSSVWVYAPNEKPSLFDAILKIFGGDVAAQCVFVESDVADSCLPNYNGTSTLCSKIQAIVPKPDSNISSLTNKGQYVYVDGRPLSGSKGILKDILKLFKSHTRRVFQQASVSQAAGAFIYLHIFCPPGTCDVNVESLKDDVIFEDPAMILRLADTLFQRAYGKENFPGEASIDISDRSTPAPGLPNSTENILAIPEPLTPFTIEDSPEVSPQVFSQLLSDCQKGKRAATHSPLKSSLGLCTVPHSREDCNVNPWTIAKRNSTIIDPIPHLPTPSRSVGLPIFRGRNYLANTHVTGRATNPGNFSPVETSPTPVRRATTQITGQQEYRQSKIISTPHYQDARPATAIQLFSISQPVSPTTASFPDRLQEARDGSFPLDLEGRFGKDTIILASPSCPALPSPVKEQVLSGPSGQPSSEFADEPRTLQQNTYSIQPFPLNESLSFERRKKEILQSRRNKLKQQSTHITENKQKRSLSPNGLRARNTVLNFSPSGQLSVKPIFPYPQRISHPLLVVEQEVPNEVPLPVKHISASLLQSHSAKQTQMSPISQIIDNRMPLDGISNQPTIHHLALMGSGSVDFWASVSRVLQVDTYVQAGSICSSFLTTSTPTDTVRQWNEKAMSLIENRLSRYCSP